jgi:hypothetical protein
MYSSYLTKLKNIFKNTPMCGLFGFIGTNPQECFSWDKFNILGWFNDSRGGDACGRVVGNLYQHGVDSLKTYKEFAMATKNPSSDVIDNIILGHCRKASSGGKNEIYTQPIILRKKDVNIKAIKDTEIKAKVKALKNDDIVCSGIHNGTIDNYLILAPKYGVPIIEHNDSKVLLNILFYGNHKVLTEYVGTAALVWHNHVTDRTYIYKGSSKSYSYSTTDNEERPLYWWYAKDNNLYLSSIEDSLLFIGAKKDEIFDIDCNKLYVFKGGVKVEKEISFDRSNSFQNEFAYTTNTTKGNRTYMGAYYHDEYHQGFGRQLSLPVVKRPLDDFIRCFMISNVQRRLQGETLNKYRLKPLKRVYFNKGRYWMHNGLLHGVYILNTIGIVPCKFTQAAALLGIYYFVEGIMIDNSIAYESALELHDKFIEDIKADPTSICAKEQDFSLEVRKFSRYAVVSLTKTDGPQDCHSNIEIDISAANGKKYYTGSFQPLFSNRLYTFSVGDLTGIVEQTDSDKYAYHDDDTNALCLEYYTDCETVKRRDDDVFQVGNKLLNDIDFENPFSPFQNVLLAVTDLGSMDQALKIMWIHYIRDFCIETVEKCMICHNDKHSILANCTKCPYLMKSFENLVKDVNYDIFK